MRVPIVDVLKIYYGISLNCNFRNLTDRLLKQKFFKQTFPLQFYSNQLNILKIPFTKKSHYKLVISVNKKKIIYY